MRARTFVICSLSCLSLALGLPGAATAQDLASVGRFGAPFVEPTINGVPSAAKCVEGDDPKFPQCKPSGNSVAFLGGDRYLYFNALENTEGVRLSIIAEFGQTAINDQTRVLDLSDDAPAWTQPEPVRANTNGGPVDAETLPGVPNDAEQEEFAYNDEALFCSDLNFLPDGRVFITGGTNYYTEPLIPGTDLGVVELEGLKMSRIYDPETNEWTQVDSMEYGRWYPTLVTLPDGDQFVASGVTKLLKPIYPERPLDSLRNVTQTETYDLEMQTWSTNPPSASRSLPLFPRLHLLPNGHVYYNAAGQAFNPFGQALDEALWNIAASYDPESQTWTDLGVPGLGTLTFGFRGSTSSVMLPLKPDDDGSYTKAELLTAGGVLLPTPGSVLPVSASRIDTVDTSGDTPALSSRATGSLSRARWYGQGVVLPDGTVLMLSGSNIDEVVVPGLGRPITRAELFDPQTEEWSPIADQGNPRTYHNTAVLMPDGRVLVGGHATISTLYLNNTTLPGGLTPQDGRDPSFQFYEPPYLFRGERPVISAAPESVTYSEDMTIATPDAPEITRVMLVRRPSLTHLVDGDQRTVELPILSTVDGEVTVASPPDGAVAPPGDYMLFINRGTEDGEIPSVSAPVRIT
ncbi:MAG: galactose oxidase-like domain-containing protein [Egibacteraceae bacterium]